MSASTVRRARAGARAVVAGLAGHRGGPRRARHRRSGPRRSSSRTGCWPAPRSPGPPGSGVGCAAARRRPGAPSSWCWPATPTATPGCSSRWSRPSRSWRRGSRWSGRGCWRCPSRGPAGYFGGELAAAERLVDQVAARTGVECQAGIAEGLFAAVLAARRGRGRRPGRTPAFLAPLGVEELDREPEVDRSELVGLLRRLGLRSLGAFGALAAGDVASRFGADAVLAHRLARGLDPRPPVRRWPPAELAVELELDPPVDRVDAAAFAARDAGAAAARGAGRARAVVHPPRGRGAHGGGGGAAPGLAVRRAAHPVRHRGPGPLAARLLAGPGRARSRRQAAAGARGDGHRGSAAARALGRRRGGGRAGGPRAGAGAGVARAGGGGHRGARRRPGSGGAGPPRALGGRPRPYAGHPADRRLHGARSRVASAGRGASSALPAPAAPADACARPAVREPPPPWPGRLPAPSPAVVPPDPLPADLRDAAGHPCLLAAPGPAHRGTAAHARRRRRAARGGARLGRAVAGAAAVVGAGGRGGEPAAGAARGRRRVPAVRPRRPVGGRPVSTTDAATRTGRHAGTPSVESAKRPIVPATASVLRSSAVRSIPSVRSHAWW